MSEVRDDPHHKDVNLPTAPSKIHSQQNESCGMINTDPQIICKSIKRSASMTDLQKSTQKKRQDAFGVSMNPCTLIIPSGNCYGCCDDSVKSDEINRPYKAELEDGKLNEQIKRPPQADREHNKNKAADDSLSEVQDCYVTPMRKNREMTTQLEEYLLRSPVKHQSSQSFNGGIVLTFDQESSQQPVSDSLLAVSNLQSIPAGLLQFTPKKYSTECSNKFITSGDKFLSHNGKYLEQHLSGLCLPSDLLGSNRHKHKSQFKPKPHRPYNQYCAECGQDAVQDYTVQACTHRLHISCKRTMNNKRRYKCPLCEIKK